jgi:cell division topological specificity factor MinE
MVSEFFDRILGRSKNDRSANTARDRLQLVLFHDRINLPPERVQEMKKELLEVLSKYIPVSGEEVDIILEPRDHARNTLRAEVPFFNTADDDDTDAKTASDGR